MLNASLARTRQPQVGQAAAATKAARPARQYIACNAPPHSGQTGKAPAISWRELTFSSTTRVSTG